MRKRAKSLLIGTGRLLAAGLFYALLCLLWGGPILPCPLYALTGWYCPGCGVSRLCLRLLTGDLAGAFAANPVLFCLLPVLGLLAVRAGVRYVRTGSPRFARWETVVLWVVLAVLLLSGVLRNFEAFSCLAPH